MPTLEEIQDETVRATNAEKDDEWDDEESDVLSDETSDDEDEVFERGLTVPQESIWQRISALKDIIPPSTRNSIAANLSRASSYGSLGVLITGKVAWVFTTTALLWGLPYALAVEDEMRVTQQERDMYSQQQGAQQMMGPPGGAPAQQGGSSPQGIRPPGF